VEWTQLDYSYTVGLAESVWTSVSAAAALFASYILALWEPWFLRRLSYLSGLGTCLLLAGAVGFGTFCVTYPLFNPLFQHDKLLDSSTSLNAFVAYESRTGLLILRLSSIAMGYGLFTAILRILRSPARAARSWRDRPCTAILRILPSAARAARSRRDRLYTAILRILRSAARAACSQRNPRYVFTRQGVTFSQELELRGELGIGLQNLAQYGVFLVVLATLWFLTIDEVQEVWPVLILNWALFFIVDDWVLINDYSYALRGLVYPSAARRIHAFNVLLSMLTVYVVIQAFSGWRVVTSLSFLALSLVIRYVTSRLVTNSYTARKEADERAEEKEPIR
jgi:hypothetical protein